MFSVNATATCALMVVASVTASTPTIGVTRAGHGAGAPAVTRAACNPGTGFAGYLLNTRNTAVSASWTVPAIEKRSVGSASTWVGDSSKTQAFVQLGTTESSSGTRTYYRAFWSDPEVTYHPQYIATVRAGDVVTSSISQGPHGWTLVFGDLTQQFSRPVGLGYGKKKTFVEAQILQEDPRNRACSDATYPRMQLVTFRSVKVDGQTPPLQADDESALISPNGIAIEPGPFQDDAFAEHFVTGAGRQYLRDVLPVDVAINEFNSSFPGSASGLRSASRVFAEDLRGQRWPPSAEPGVRRLVGHEHRIVEELGHTEDPSDPLSPVQSSLRADLTFAGAVRAALGLPPTDPK